MAAKVLETFADRLRAGGKQLTYRELFRLGFRGWYQGPNGEPMPTPTVDRPPSGVVYGPDTMLMLIPSLLMDAIPDTVLVETMEGHEVTWGSCKEDSRRRGVDYTFCCAGFRVWWSRDKGKDRHQKITEAEAEVMVMRALGETYDINLAEDVLARLKESIRLRVAKDYAYVVTENLKILQKCSVLGTNQFNDALENLHAFALASVDSKY
jgi:hypothetical protein